MAPGWKRRPRFAVLTTMMCAAGSGQALCWVLTRVIRSPLRW